jgi:hypothetical protein
MLLILIKFSGINCNIYAYDEKEKCGIYPYQTSKKNYRKTVNLLILSEGEIFHYVLIRSLRNVLKKKTEYNKSEPTCSKCFRRFTKERLLWKHRQSCKNDVCQTEEMPTDEILCFKNFQHRQPNLVNVYAG